jgi:hypothetical protein
MKKNRESEESRPVLLAQIKQLQDTVTELTSQVKSLQNKDKIEDWQAVKTTTKVLRTAEPPPLPKIMRTCSVCGREFDVNRSDTARSWQPWALPRELKNFAKAGFLYWACSLPCCERIVREIDLLSGDIAVKRRARFLDIG